MSVTDHTGPGNEGGNAASAADPATAAPPQVSGRSWHDPVRDKPIDFDGRTLLGEWVESLPDFGGLRPAMTCNGYLNLLRHMLAGGSVPYYVDPSDLLRDVLVSNELESSRLRRRAETAEADAARYEPAIQCLWLLVFATGKRKTMRTDEVRAALESAQ